MQTDIRYPQDETGGDERFLTEQLRVLRRFVRIRVGADDADDVASEAVCQFIEYCQASGIPVMSARPLLFRIARRRIIDYYRQSGERRQSIPLDGASPIAAPGSLSHVVDASEEIQEIHVALAMLRPEDRKIIELRAFEGLGIQEIAVMLGASAVGVRVRLHRARKQLKAQLRSAEHGKVQKVHAGAVSRSSAPVVLPDQSYAKPLEQPNH